MAKVQAKQPQPPGARLATLKGRVDFLRIRKGARWATPGFVLEAKRRSDGSLTEQARFGFTVSKQVGGAVDRNRIKRRLKAAVRGVVHEYAQRDFDYVLIARRPALDAVFAALVSDLVKALGRVHANPAQGQGRAGRK